MLHTKTTLGIGYAVIFVLTLAACNGKGGFATGLPGDSSSNGKTSTVDPTNPSSEPSEFQKLQYKGYLSGGSDSGKLAIDIDKVNGALLLILPLQMNAFVDAAEGQIPELPGVKFVTYADPKGATYIAVSVPLRYVLKGASFLPPARLPNGDALPQIAGGELPSVALKIPGKNNVQFHVYVGLDTICLYVSSPFDPYVNMTFPIKNSLTTIGYLSTVKAKAGYDGGFFMSTQMPSSVARIIDDHFQF